MRSDPRLTAEEIVCLQMKSPLQFHSLADGFRPARRGFESTDYWLSLAERNGLVVH